MFMRFFTKQNKNPKRVPLMIPKKLFSSLLFFFMSFLSLLAVYLIFFVSQSWLNSFPLTLRSCIALLCWGSYVIPLIFALYRRKTQISYEYIISLIFTFAVLLLFHNTYGTDLYASIAPLFPTISFRLSMNMGDLIPFWFYLTLLSLLIVSLLKKVQKSKKG